MNFLTYSFTGLNCLGFLDLLEFSKDLLACGEYFQNGRKAELFGSAVLQVPDCFETLLLCMLLGNIKKLACHIYSFIPPVLPDKCFCLECCDTWRRQWRFTLMTNKLYYFHIYLVYLRKLKENLIITSQLGCSLFPWPVWKYHPHCNCMASAHALPSLTVTMLPYNWAMLLAPCRWFYFLSLFLLSFEKGRK